MLCFLFLQPHIARHMPRPSTSPAADASHALHGLPTRSLGIHHSQSHTTTTTHTVGYRQLVAAAMWATRRRSGLQRVTDATVHRWRVVVLLYAGLFARTGRCRLPGRIAGTDQHGSTPAGQWAVANPAVRLGCLHSTCCCLSTSVRARLPSTLDRTAGQPLLLPPLRGLWCGVRAPRRREMQRTCA